MAKVEGEVSGEHLLLSGPEGHHQTQSIIKRFHIVSIFWGQVNCPACIFVPSLFYTIIFFPPRSYFMFSYLWLFVR